MYRYRPSVCLSEQVQMDDVPSTVQESFVRCVDYKVLSRRSVGRQALTAVQSPAQWPTECTSAVETAADTHTDRQTDTYDHYRHHSQ